MMNLEKEIREQPEVLSAVLACNESVYAGLLTQLRQKKPRNVYFAARGTSDHASIFAQYLFALYLGMPCGLSTPSAISQYGAKINYADSLVIGVSQSGAAEDVLSVLNDAKQSGAITVAVTNTKDSPLAKAADFHLDCSAGPELSIAATKTFTAQMYLLAGLCARWSGSEVLADELAMVPKTVENALRTLPDQIRSMISDYRNMKNGVVLGRGMLYPIALEGALKILETNQLRMKGYSVSDFYHGPFAQLSGDETVFLLAGAGPCFKDSMAMLKKLNDNQIKTVVITDAETLTEPASQILRLPKTGSDVVTAFSAAVAMQLFAAILAQTRGIDPDQSKVLKKVTVTK